MQIDDLFMRHNIEKTIGNEKCFSALFRSNGKIIGLMFASLGNFFFSKSLFGIESGMFVLPEHRGGRAAIAMYQEFIKWCDKNNAEPFVEIFFSDDDTNEKTYQFFRKSGLKDCGRMFRRS